MSNNDLQNIKMWYTIFVVNCVHKCRRTTHWTIFSKNVVIFQYKNTGLVYKLKFNLTVQGGSDAFIVK